MPQELRRKKKDKNWRAAADKRKFAFYSRLREQRDQKQRAQADDHKEDLRRVDPIRTRVGVGDGGDVE